MAEIEEVEVAANGWRFDTLVAGPADGEPVILLHGYPQSAHSWDLTVRWLADHGYRAIAPNLRGYSVGANPQEASAYTMDQLVADVAAIADASGVTRFHLVGHDWGGALAWALAARRPGRVQSLTVLSTPHPAAMIEALRSSTQMLRSGYMAFFRIPRLPEMLMSAGGFVQVGLACRLSGLPTASWERDRARLQRVGLRGPLNWYRGATGQPRRQRRIDSPTLYVWGRHDPFLGRRAAEGTADHVRGPYRFVALDAGHWIPERNADQLNVLLAEHLSAHPLARPAPARSPRATTAGSAPAARQRPRRSRPRHR